MPEIGVGIGWAGGDWLAVRFDGTVVTDASVERSVKAIWEDIEDLDIRTVIDVPIGLLSDEDGKADGGERNRNCDDEARDFVGGDRAPSVYNAPCREAVEMKRENPDVEHKQISDCNRDVTEKGLSSQSINIIDAVSEVDEFVCDDEVGDVTGDDDTLGRILEGHPEVCFRTFSGTELNYPKGSAAGLAERLDALEGEPPLLEDPADAVRTICDAMNREGNRTFPSTTP